MNKTKKSLLALLLTSMLTIGLAGCSQNTDSTNTATAKTANTSTDKLQLNNTQGQTADKSGQDKNAVQDPYANDPSIQEVRKAFTIGAEYLTITMPSISGIALGKFEAITITKDQRLELARALTSAMVNSGWEQDAPPPGLFVNHDGMTFMVGMKKKNGDFTLETYKYQDDKTYKSVKKEVKQASK